MLIVAVLVASTALTSCNTAPPPGGTSLTITAYFTGPMYPLDNSWGSPAFPILVGHVNSCVNLDPTGTTYRAACRVVNGYDWGGGSSPALNDTTNWDIKIIAGHAKSAINNPGYGYSINPYFTPYCQGDCAPNNAINEFEGCTKVASWDGQWPLHSAATSTDEWRCDYAVYDWAMIKPASTSWSSDVMAALWPSWWRHTADDAACAAGMGAGVAGYWPGFAAGLYGCQKSTLSNVQPSGAVVNGGSSTTTLPTIQQGTTDVLPNDPVQPGDPTPTIPVG